MRAVAAGVYYPFRDALMIKMEDFLAEVKILQQRRPTRAELE